MYFSDEPITKSEDDQLGREGFARILAQSLVNLKVTDTFTIGLFGKWGSGKTSIINMTLHELDNIQRESKEENKIVVVKFEPWNFSSTDQLLSQFFIRLSSELKSKKDENLTTIADALDEYSEGFELLKAIPSVGGVLTLLGKAGAKAISKKLKKGDNSKDIQKQKKYIIDLLSKQSKRILVVIDDIDRLSNEQIRQVFQLIASVARFPNTMYLLVFDKDIVVEALKKVQEGNGEDYLEKIIQMPIQIPDAQKASIRNALYEKLNLIIQEYGELSFQQERWDRLFRYCIDPFTDNLRVVNRLCNSVRFKLTTVYSEIDFFDMIAISAIEIALPQVYEWIKKNKAALTGLIDVTSFSFLHDRSQKELSLHYRSEILDLVNNDQGKLESAINCLSRLFPYFGNKIGEGNEAYDRKRLMRDSNIAHPDKFDRYFKLDLGDGELKKAEIRNAIFALNEEDFEAYLLELDTKRRSYDFLEEINSIGEALPYNRVEVIIRALFNISSKLDETNSSVPFVRASSHAMYLIMDLFETIDHQCRMQLLIDKTNNATTRTLPIVALLIERIELGYGRLDANGEEKNDFRIVSLEELVQLEDLFKQKAEDLLKTYNMFDFPDWTRVAYLLEYFDPEYLKKYYVGALQSTRNIVLFFSSSVSEWIGSGTEYEIGSSYKKYLTEDQVTKAILALKDSGELFQLPETIQRKCAAFYLYQNNSRNNHDQVLLAEVEKQLQEWKM